MPDFDKFTKFLKENGCDEKFDLAFSEQNHKCFNQYTYDLLPFEENAVNAAFDWSETKEGREYWKAIDDRWCDICEGPGLKAES